MGVIYVMLIRADEAQTISIFTFNPHKSKHYVSVSLLQRKPNRVRASDPKNPHKKQLTRKCILVFWM